ncbi:MAG: dUTP diphosphatase [Candidatus Pacearchaeota archaeon]|jgi:dUTP pyrophosphatase
MKKEDNNPVLKVKRLTKNAELPEYALDCDVAFDLRANELVTLESMEQKEIKTGIAIEIPKGYIGLVRDRAGIVTKMGLHAVAGTFDSSYRGEVTIIMINFSMDAVDIEPEMRIAQMILVPINKLEIQEVKELSKTPRTGKEIGSTGLSDVLKELNKIAEKGDKRLSKMKK